MSRRTEGLLVVRQVDHQDQCRLMAEAWGGPGFERIEPWNSLRDAAAWHDEGWRGWERWPEIDERGCPVDFPDLDRAQHVRLYAEGIRRVASRSDRAGLLVSMHGQGLYERRLGLDGEPEPRAGRRCEIGAFLAGQESVQATARERLGDGAGLRAWAWAAYRLLQAWDLMSLYLVWRALPSRQSGSVPSVPRRVGDAGVRLALTPTGPGSALCTPYPFREDPIALPVAVRRIEDRTYRSHADLRAALGAAEWLTLDVAIHGLRGQAD